MKIEIGESLIASWLKHVKMCQIIQTNWRVSPQWSLMHREDIELIKTEIDKALYEHFDGKSIFKQNANVSQLLNQGECDVIGIKKDEGGERYYAVDIAFHENGLQYGGKLDASMKVAEKCVRTAMCIYSYLNCKEGDIIFATPKVINSYEKMIGPAIDIIQRTFDELGYNFKFAFIANADFNDTILDPVLKAGESVSDSNELFLRATRLVQVSKNSRGRRKE